MHGKYLIWQLLGYNLKKLLSCLTSPLNLSECNISCKKTLLNIESNLSYLSIFRLELEKTTVLWYFTSATSNFSKRTISPKKKNPEIRNKNCRYFGKKLLSILGWNFKKLMPYLKSASSNLLTCNVSSKTKKI